AQLAKCITHPIPQSTFDALTSHAWNLGWPNTCNSQSVRLINQGWIKEGCELLSNKPDGRPNWSNSGGNFIRGLFNRRLSERELCLKDLQEALWPPWHSLVLCGYMGIANTNVVLLTSV